MVSRSPAYIARTMLAVTDVTGKARTVTSVPENGRARLGLSATYFVCCKRAEVVNSLDTLCYYKFALICINLYAKSGFPWLSYKHPFENLHLIGRELLSLAHPEFVL